MKSATLLITVLVGFGLAACSSGGSSSTPGSSSTKGLSLPTEISAVPTDANRSSKIGLKSKLMAFKAATDPDTDYSRAVTTKFVDEHTLEQFEIIEQVLGALAQTHYAEAINIGQGPYKAMVAWQDEQNGIETKTLEPWIVQSDIITENGAEVTRARAWIEEVQGGQKQLIKAEFKIYAAATQAADGSYNNYGVWTLNVKFGEQVTDFFAASASIGSNGESIIKLHERFPEGPGFTMEVKAILNKSDSSGFGKVSFPDWESCRTELCTPPQLEVKYAYNTNHLAVQKAGDTSPTYKERANITEMTHRYGLYDSLTGQDVFKVKSFGFPVFYTDNNGFRNYAYYGAFQGRHELWTGGPDGQGIPAGTVVTRDDHGQNATAQHYTVSAPFVGTLVKRTTVDGSLNDILNIPLETWINKNYNIRWNNTAGRWDACVNPEWDPNTFEQSCAGGKQDFTPILPLLEMSGSDNRKFVNVSGWDNVAQQAVDYLYIATDAAAVAAGGSVAGFYKAQMDTQTNQIVILSPAALYTPADGDDLWVDIGGSIYIEYVGTGTTGWLEKTLTAFDQRTWTPEFAAGGKDYTLPENQELYINSKGTNYIVKRVGAVTKVELEIQTVANPLNAATFVPSGTVFKSSWNPDNDSTYTFDTDPNSPSYMKLVYATIGDNDRDGTGQPNPGVSVGAVVTDGQWGLAAYNALGEDTGVQYNWDYPREGDNWGKVTYLIDGNGDYVLLSDPIQFLPISLTNGANPGGKTFVLQYDGWMHGLPDLFEALRKNDFVIDASIASKIFNIPAGTAVTDAADSTKRYLIKPLEISQFLNPVPDPGTLDISVADSVDLNTVPDFVEHHMGPMPLVTTTRYSEGVLVE